MNISEIYEKSWNVTKNHKGLWIFAFVLGVLSGSTYNFNNSGSSNSNQESGSSMGRWLLGRGYNPQAVYETLKELFSQIPAGVWIWLVLVFLFVLSVSFIFILFAWNWAEASLIGGIDLALKGEKADLSASSKIGRNSVGRKILLGLLVSIPTFLIIVVVLAIFAFGISTENTILMLFGSLLLLFTIFLVVLVLFSLVWSERVLVIEGLGVVESLVKGVRLFLKNSLETIILALLNCVTSCIVMAVVVGGILLGILGVALSGFGSVISPVLLPFMVIGAVIFIVVMVAAQVVGGAFKTFLYSTWNVLYNQAKEKLGKKEGENG